MKISHALLTAFLLCGFAGIGACSQPDSGSAQGSRSQIADTIASAMDKASVKLRTGNVGISSDHLDGAHAEITPQGDLVLDGKPVAVTPQQRALLLEYRARLLDIAEQGMQIGKQGVGLAANAVGTALDAAFSGKSQEQVRAQVEAEATGIRRSAAKLCDRLPEMMAAQQKLAAALPAFKPYATMTQADIDDCREEVLKKDDP